MDLILKLLLVIGFVAFANADKDIENKDVKVKIRGQSGKITFARKGNSVTVNFDYIKELDKDGNVVGETGRTKHSINSFARENFNFHASSKATYQGIPVKHVQFSATVSGPGAKLTVDIYLFKGNGSVNTSNSETIDVKEGSIKFNIQLANWTFCGGSGGDACKKGSTDQLGSQVEFGIEIKGRNNPKKKAKAKGRGRKVETLDLGGADVTLSGAVKLDGTWQEMVSGYPKVETKPGKNLFVFRFPKFTRDVFYDPTVDMSSNQYNGSSPVIKSSLMPMLFAIAVIIKHLF